MSRAFWLWVGLEFKGFPRGSSIYSSRMGANGLCFGPKARNIWVLGYLGVRVWYDIGIGFSGLKGLAAWGLMGLGLFGFEPLEVQGRGHREYKLQGFTKCFFSIHAV